MQQSGATTGSLRSRKFCIGFFIACFIFFIIGGILLYVWSGGPGESCDRGPHGDYPCAGEHTGELIGSIPMFALSAICYLIGWIFLITYCVQRRRFAKANITSADAPMVTPQLVHQQDEVASQPADSPATRNPVGGLFTIGHFVAFITFTIIGGVLMYFSHHTAAAEFWAGVTIIVIGVICFVRGCLIILCYYLCPLCGVQPDSTPSSGGDARWFLVGRAVGLALEQSNSPDEQTP